MTRGSIVRQVVGFSLPLMLGNIFQMLYNTVDSIVVGNYVSTQALAAVGSTTMIINMLVFFFNGFSVGAGVVIGHYFGARETKRLHTAVQTTMTSTFILCLAFTFIGLAAVRPMLRFMNTPADVFDEAAIYLTIYFYGISGLLIYNIGSGILRAVGNSTLPLAFLMVTSVLNIVLDLAFVIGLGAGISGVAYATIISQFVSAVLTLYILSTSNDVYRLTWNDLRVDRGVLKRIFSVGLPAAVQSVLTAFSNVFVQSYVNYFGSACMAGWSCYNKLDQFIMLPMQSLSMAATTFVSQNIGANQRSRANRGAVITVLMCVGVTAVVALGLFVTAEPAIGLFTRERPVIDFGVMFIRTNVFFLLFNCVNHTLAGALRGRGDSKAPMIIMLLSFVGVRQVYLFFITRYVANTARLVGFGYPVGWMVCCVIEVTYFWRRWRADDAPTAKQLI
ncbi:MAG: MATE family efflux transporter [Clostridia bacterium]|nr:MATE family efflux transporter [Clostridia bacterium]